MSEIRLEGRVSPEVSIKQMCLCGEKDCVHNESIDIVFNVIARVKWDDLKDVINQIHDLDSLGWQESENKYWELILREKKVGGL